MLVDELKQRGFPLTRARRAIANEFETVTQAFSAVELLSKLHERGLKVNKTTVYRELDNLVREHLVEELDMGEGLKRYELSPNRHHHHVFCTACKKVICLPMEDELHLVEKRIEQDTHFVVQGHDLKFFGICQQCSLLAPQLNADSK